MNIGDYMENNEIQVIKSDFLQKSDFFNGIKFLSKLFLVKKRIVFK